MGLCSRQDGTGRPPRSSSPGGLAIESGGNELRHDIGVIDIGVIGSGHGSMVTHGEVAGIERVAHFGTTS